MARKNDSAVRLTDRDKEFLQSLVDKGDYITLSEANRAGIRLLKTRHDKVPV